MKRIEVPDADLEHENAAKEEKELRKNPEIFKPESATLRAETEAAKSASDAIKVGPGAAAQDGLRPAGTLTGALTGHLGWLFELFEFGAAVAVQLLMLAQTGVTYLLLRWRHRRSTIPPGLVPLQPIKEPALLSIIIPAFNEARTIASSLKSIALSAASLEHVEVVVVDAGGSDGTMALAAEAAAGLASSHGLRVRLEAGPGGGRGPTLNAGVAAARGDLLLFLHADTTLPPRFDASLRAALAKEAVLATAFRFRVQRGGGGSKPIVGLAWMEFTVNVRSRLFQLPFGDQAIAITRQRLAAVHGFPSEPIMEDFELVQKLRRASAGGAGRIETLPDAAECSGRRWEARGVWRTNLTNQVVMLAYVYGGESPSEIYRLYYHSTIWAWLWTKAVSKATKLPVLGHWLGIMLTPSKKEL